MKIEINKRGDGLWQADRDNDHALGVTPGEAVDRLIEYIEAVAAAAAAAKRVAEWPQWKRDEMEAFSKRQSD